MAETVRSLVSILERALRGIPSLIAASLWRMCLRARAVLRRLASAWARVLLVRGVGVLRGIRFLVGMVRF